MDERENTFPMDFYVRDSSPHPWKFKPEGYLVVILSDADEAQRLVALLSSALPGIALEVVHGGQPHYAYLVAAE